MDNMLLLYVNYLSGLDFGFTFCGQDSSLRNAGYIKDRELLEEAVQHNQVTTVTDGKPINLSSDMHIRYVPISITYDRLVDYEAKSKWQIYNLPESS